jgi:endoglucanase Acf2
MSPVHPSRRPAARHLASRDERSPRGPLFDRTKRLAAMLAAATFVGSAAFGVGAAAPALAAGTAGTVVTKPVVAATTPVKDAGDGMSTAVTDVSKADATSPVGAPEADGVKVGAGSYAPTPPSDITDSGDVQKTLNQKLNIDPSQAGKPVPTNQWWTNALVSPYSGDLWQYPFVSDTTAQGTELRYPTQWNAAGTAMTLDNPITIGGQVVPQGDPSDQLMADFENGVPSGWTATGNAFGSTATATEPGQSQVSGWIGNGFLDSFTADQGDGATGTLTSPAFTVDRNDLAFMIGGGNHPGDEAVNLVIGGKVVDTATGDNSEQLKWTTWDLSQYQGQSAQIQIVDNLGAGWAHILVDQILQTDNVTGIDTRFSTTFNSPSTTVTKWSDWSVSLRQTQGGGTQHIDSTLVQGDPYEWFQFTGMTPSITVQDGASITDSSGDPITFPVTTDRLEITENGHSFGIHAPDNTTFTQHGDVLDASAGTGYLVVSAIPKSGLTLDQLQKYAFALPTDTKMDYSYDAAKGQVEENWNITTTPLEGTNLDTIQGWEKHQYKDASNNLQFTGATYATPRGTMKTTIGHGGWTLDYAFEGIPLIDGTPQELGLPSDYSPDLMKQYVDSYAQKTTYGGDTYWGGKDLQQLGDYMMIAKQIGDTTAEAKLESSLRTALTDWYTYTAGESEHFFAFYPTWKALIGFGDSYGSAQFNDNHFHYGYFAVASALLGAVDPTWAAQYGQMATMVVQEYSNWDRSSTTFPYLRTFGVWEGHSNAGGVSSPGGNNQESSSEAIQSEAGEFLLGSVLGDKQMQATGAMEYVTERAAVREYYQNAAGNPASATYDGDGEFPAAYPAAQTGILFDSGQASANYFSGDLAWNYAIQWLPNSSWDGFFGWDPKFSNSIMTAMMKARPLSVGQGGTIADNAAAVQTFLKQWWGVGTYGTTVITQDQNAAIATLEAAIREAEKNNPGYVTAKTAANPLYDAASDTLYVSLAADGSVVFPAQYWKPATLPASLIPAHLSSADADKNPVNWPVPSALLAYLSTNYTADAATIDSLYGIDLTNYKPGVDTAHAEQVFSQMGDALGTSVLAFLGEYDPDTYADIHQALLKAGDPMASTATQSLSAIVYYNSMSTRTLGTELTTRHTSDPLSEVYKNAAGQYSYVMTNTDTVQHTYDVYDGTNVIGQISVPANSQITSHLDAKLSKIVVATTGSPKTLVPGSSTGFTATGYDQYGATIDLPGLTWTATAGSIDADGTFTAGDAAPTAEVTATSGGVSTSYSFRVAAAPQLTSLAVTPGFQRVIVGTAQQFTAKGLDQYGDPFSVTAPITWNYSGPGSVSAAGSLTTTGPGSGYVVATAGSVQGSAVASSVAPLADLARTGTATASSSLGANVPALAIDGDDTTRWESEHGVDDVDFTVDLGRESDISSVGILWEAAAASKYVLQVADSADGPWTDVTTVTKTDASPDTDAANATARYVRMHGISRLTNYGYSIKSFTVSGTPDVSTITPTAVLVSPQTASVLPGTTTQLTAYAFDAAGNGGPTDATWADTGSGSVTSAGVFTAAAVGGASADSVTATVGGVSGTSSITTLANAAPTPTGVDQDVAVGKAVTTSSDESSGVAGAYAVDGQANTRWSSGFSDDQWIQVDLGQVLPVDSIQLDWERAYASTFQVQVRNDPSDPWTTVVDEAKGAGGNESYDLSHVSARYVRMLGGTRATSYGYSLYEFGVYSTQGAPTPDLALNTPVTTSSDENPTAFPATNAVDGDLGSRWASGHTDGEWLDVDLGQPQALHQATLTWENAYGKAYEIQGRNSPTDPWSTLATMANGQGGTDTLALTGSYRYVRFQGVERGTPYGYSLYEFAIQ